MTLWVTAYRRNPDGSRSPLELPSHLAGFESARADFYGAVRHRELGLKRLPELADGDLRACGAELADLLADVELLLRHLPSGEEGEYWRLRLENIRTAVEIASSHGDDGIVEIA